MPRTSMRSPPNLPARRSRRTAPNTSPGACTNSRCPIPTKRWSGSAGGRNLSTWPAWRENAMDAFVEWCAALRFCHAFAHRFEAGDEARQRVRRRAPRQHHPDPRELPAALRGATKCRGKLPPRRDPFADAADRGRDIGKVPVVEIVETRFRLEHAQHFPAHVVEQHDDRIEPVAAAITRFPPGHFERAV